jgi:hypothetical protein
LDHLDARLTGYRQRGPAVLAPRRVVGNGGAARRTMKSLDRHSNNIPPPADTFYPQLLAKKGVRSHFGNLLIK